MTPCGSSDTLYTLKIINSCPLFFQCNPFSSILCGNLQAPLRLENIPPAQYFHTFQTMLFTHAATTTATFQFTTGKAFRLNWCYLMLFPLLWVPQGTHLIIVPKQFSNVRCLCCLIPLRSLFLGLFDPLVPFPFPELLP